MNKIEQAVRKRANLEHARAVASFCEDRDPTIPTPHDKLQRGKRYVMNCDGHIMFVRIITIESELYYVAPSGFPFRVATAPHAEFWLVSKTPAVTRDEAQYRLEIVNEGRWHPYGPRLALLDDCLLIVQDLLNQEVAARAAEVRVVNDHGQVIWSSGRLVDGAPALSCEKLPPTN